jgi:hypothetical protein
MAPSIGDWIVTTDTTKVQNSKKQIQSTPCRLLDCMLAGAQAGFRLLSGAAIAHPCSNHVRAIDRDPNRSRGERAGDASEIDHATKTRFAGVLPQGMAPRRSRARGHTAGGEGGEGSDDVWSVIGWHPTAQPARVG